MKKYLSVILCISLLFSVCCFASAAADTDNEEAVPENYKYLIDNDYISGENFSDNGFWTFEHEKKNVTATFTGVDLAQKSFSYKFKKYHENRNEFLNYVNSTDVFLGKDGDGNLYFSSSSIKTRQFLFGITFTSLYSPVLVKISPDGEILWSKTYSAKKIYRIYSLCVLKSGDIVISGQSIDKMFNCTIKPTALLLDSEGKIQKQIMLTGSVNTFARFVPCGEGAAAITKSGIIIYDADMCITQEKVLKGYEPVAGVSVKDEGLPIFVKSQNAAKGEKSVRFLTLDTDGKTKTQKEISRGKFGGYIADKISGCDDFVLKLYNADGDYQYKIYTGDYKCRGTLNFESDDFLYAVYDGEGYLFAVGKALGEDKKDPENMEYTFTYFDKNLKQQWQYVKKSL